VIANEPSSMSETLDKVTDPTQLAGIEYRMAEYMTTEAFNADASFDAEAFSVPMFGIEQNINTIQQTVGCTAKEWIDDYVILELKVTLHSTALSIQEIANQFNFPDQSYLGRYFKHHTGMSPTAYRAMK